MDGWAQEVDFVVQWRQDADLDVTLLCNGKVVCATTKRTAFNEGNQVYANCGASDLGEALVETVHIAPILAPPGRYTLQVELFAAHDDPPIQWESSFRQGGNEERMQGTFTPGNEMQEVWELIVPASGDGHQPRDEGNQEADKQLVAEKELALRVAAEVAKRKVGSGSLEDAGAQVASILGRMGDRAKRDAYQKLVTHPAKATAPAGLLNAVEQQQRQEDERLDMMFALLGDQAPSSSSASFRPAPHDPQLPSPLPSLSRLQTANMDKKPQLFDVLTGGSKNDSLSVPWYDRRNSEANGAVDDSQREWKKRMHESNAVRELRDGINRWKELGVGTELGSQQYSSRAGRGPALRGGTSPLPQLPARQEYVSRALSTSPGSELPTAPTLLMPPSHVSQRQLPDRDMSPKSATSPSASHLGSGKEGRGHTPLYSAVAPAQSPWAVLAAAQETATAKASTTVRSSPPSYASPAFFRVEWSMNADLDIYLFKDNKLVVSSELGGVVTATNKDGQVYATCKDDTGPSGKEKVAVEMCHLDTTIAPPGLYHFKIRLYDNKEEPQDSAVGWKSVLVHGKKLEEREGTISRVGSMTSEPVAEVRVDQRGGGAPSEGWRSLQSNVSAPGVDLFELQQLHHVSSAPIIGQQIAGSIRSLIGMLQQQECETAKSAERAQALAFAIQQQQLSAISRLSRGLSRWEQRWIKCAFAAWVSRVDAIKYLIQFMSQTVKRWGHLEVDAAMQTWKRGALAVAAADRRRAEMVRLYKIMGTAIRKWGFAMQERGLGRWFEYVEWLEDRRERIGRMLAQWRRRYSAAAFRTWCAGTMLLRERMRNEARLQFLQMLHRALMKWAMMLTGKAFETWRHAIAEQQLQKLLKMTVVRWELTLVYIGLEKWKGWLDSIHQREAWVRATLRVERCCLFWAQGNQAVGFEHWQRVVQMMRQVDWEWEEWIDPNGYAFYFNRLTQQSVWEKPDVPDGSIRRVGGLFLSDGVMFEGNTLDLSLTGQSDEEVALITLERWYLILERSQRRQLVFAMAVWSWHADQMVKEEELSILQQMKLEALAVVEKQKKRWEASWETAEKHSWAADERKMWSELAGKQKGKMQYALSAHEIERERFRRLYICARYCFRQRRYTAFLRWADCVGMDASPLNEAERVASILDSFPIVRHFMAATPQPNDSTSRKRMYDYHGEGPWYEGESEDDDHEDINAMNLYWTATPRSAERRGAALRSVKEEAVRMMAIPLSLWRRRLIKHGFEWWQSQSQKVLSKSKHEGWRRKRKACCIIWPHWKAHMMGSAIAKWAKWVEGMRAPTHTIGQILVDKIHEQYMDAFRLWGEFDPRVALQARAAKKMRRNIIKIIVKSFYKHMQAGLDSWKERHAERQLLYRVLTKMRAHAMDPNGPMGKRFAQWHKESRAATFFRPHEHLKQMGGKSQYYANSDQHKEKLQEFLSNKGLD
jgi:hypothetical protein